MLLDDMSDITECDTRLDDVDRLIQTFLRDLDEALGMLGHFADAEHLAGIAMEAIFYYGDIDINGVAGLEGLAIAGNAVTDDVVYRGTDGFWETIVIQRGRDGLLYIDNVVVTDSI